MLSAVGPDNAALSHIFLHLNFLDAPLLISTLASTCGRALSTHVLASENPVVMPALNIAGKPRVATGAFILVLREISQGGVNP